MGVRNSGPRQVPLPATGLPGLDLSISANIAQKQPRMIDTLYGISSSPVSPTIA